MLTPFIGFGNSSTHLSAVKEEFDILCVGSIVQKRESLKRTFWERRPPFRQVLKTAVGELDKARLGRKDAHYAKKKISFMHWRVS